MKCGGGQDFALPSLGAYAPPVGFTNIDFEDDADKMP